MIIPLPPQAQRNVELQLFLYLSAFSSLSLCNEYFSETQSLPKLNTLDLSLVLSFYDPVWSRVLGKRFHRLITSVALQ